MSVSAPAAADSQNHLNLVIYYNDCIDSDNITSALALLRDTQRKANGAGVHGSTRIVWILEPRQVALGLGMTREQTDECKKLIAEHFPDRGLPFKVLLGGLLTEEEDIKPLIGKLTDHQIETLRLAISPKYGPRTDAELHALLMGWDFANCLSDWAQSPVRVFIDYDSLEEVQNPVNLNIHFHEELVTRSRSEVDAYQAIMEDPELSPIDALPQRIERLREWYHSCVATAAEITNERDSTVDALDFGHLCSTIRAAGTVRFLGGSSVRILKRFIEVGLAEKIQCHLQLGSCDMSGNLFSNQFNVALNIPAAEYVLEHCNRFARFTVVPSHSAQAVKYKLTGLTKEGGTHLESRILGFNCQENPARIAARETTLSANYSNKSSPMPDLTSFMCELQPGFMGSTPAFVKVVHDGPTVLFKRVEAGEGGAIPMCDIGTKRELEGWEVEQIWKLLTGWF